MHCKAQLCPYYGLVWAKIRTILQFLGQVPQVEFPPYLLDSLWVTRKVNL
jgi:hypothetical protein